MLKQSDCQGSRGVVRRASNGASSSLDRSQGSTQRHYITRTRKRLARYEFETGSSPKMMIDHHAAKTKRTSVEDVWRIER